MPKLTIEYAVQPGQTDADAQAAARALLQEEAALHPNGIFSDDPSWNTITDASGQATLIAVLPYDVPGGDSNDVTLERPREPVEEAEVVEEQPEPSTCQAVKGDGEVCGREKPCFYHPLSNLRK